MLRFFNRQRASITPSQCQPSTTLTPTQVPTLLSLVFDTTFLTPSIEYVAKMMVSLVRQAFNDTIAQEEWLDRPTVVLAQRKLKAALVWRAPVLQRRAP